MHDEKKIILLNLFDVGFIFVCSLPLVYNIKNIIMYLLSSIRVFESSVYHRIHETHIFELQ